MEFQSLTVINDNDDDDDGYDNSLSALVCRRYLFAGIRKKIYFCLEQICVHTYTYVGELK